MRATRAGNQLGWSLSSGAAVLRPRDARPVADMLLSHEGHELRIGPRVRPRG